MNLKNYIAELVAPKPVKATDATLLDGITYYGDSIGHTVFAGLPGHHLTQPGDTARNAWLRFPYDVRHTKTVIIQQGTNDLTAGNDPFPYIEKMMRYAQAEGRRVILAGVSKRVDHVAADVQVDLNRRLCDLSNTRMNAAGFLFWGVWPYSGPDMLHPDEDMVNYLRSPLKYWIK